MIGGVQGGELCRHIPPVAKQEGVEGVEGGG
jgi:hypothetical protein